MQLEQVVTDRFWSRVDRSGGFDSCWPWTGGKSNSGYGAFHVIGEGQWRTHRLAYTLYYGQIPAGMLICHRCDNPICCNPAHLFAGTARDNNQDTVNKGRHNPWPGTRAGQTKGASAGGRKMGRVNGKKNAKLTYALACEIRRLYAQGNIGYTRLARMFKVGPSTIRAVVLGERYTDE